MKRHITILFVKLTFTLLCEYFKTFVLKIGKEKEELREKRKEFISFAPII